MWEEELRELFHVCTYNELVCMFMDQDAQFRIDAKVAKAHETLAPFIVSKFDSITDKLRAISLMLIHVKGYNVSPCRPLVGHIHLNLSHLLNIFDHLQNSPHLHQSHSSASNSTILSTTNTIGHGGSESVKPTYKQVLFPSQLC